MALIDLLRYFKFGELTTQQRAKLKQILRKEMRVLQALTKAADRGLKALAKKPKKRTAKRTKRAAKRKTARRRSGG
jgi:hypothetical protein